ncbi:MAG TPA: hypothetical protein VN207_01280 [Ktedonobacteraceae bacterium]|nr:hypothetical protein [Ktedonobacteraceae bacterium]
MEDFQAAFFQRHKDVETLHEKQRCIASMHIGGVAVECLLKAMLCTTLPKNSKGVKEWYDKEKRNNAGHTISNPGHNYKQALRSHNRLYNRIMRESPYVLQWLEKIENPECHFIDMRYTGKDPDNRKYEAWYDAYCKVVGWLLKQKF